MGIKGSWSDPQLKTLSPNIFWMVVCFTKKGGGLLTESFAQQIIISSEINTNQITNNQSKKWDKTNGRRARKSY